MRPMLAKIGSPQDLKKKGWIFEPKLDGYRAIISWKNKALKITSRNGINLLAQYPALGKISKSLKGDCIVDGEIIVLGEYGRPEFQLLQNERDDQIIIAFDILEWKGKDLRNTPLIERKKFLEKAVKDSHAIAKCAYSENGEKIFAVTKEMGLEGIVAKRADSPYVEGRSSNWLKVKMLKTIDCVIVGFTQGTGGRQSSFGSLCLGCYHNGSLTYIGNVGTGMSDKFLDELLKKLKKIVQDESPVVNTPKLARKVKWVKPKLVAEIEFLEVTRDLRLRAPVFLRLRSDKQPKECVLDVQI